MNEQVATTYIIIVRTYILIVRYVDASGVQLTVRQRFFWTGRGYSFDIVMYGEASQQYAREISLGRPWSSNSGGVHAIRTGKTTIDDPRLQ